MSLDAAYMRLSTIASNIENDAKELFFKTCMSINPDGMRSVDMEKTYSKLSDSLKAIADNLDVFVEGLKALETLVPDKEVAYRSDIEMLKADLTDLSNSLYEEKDKIDLGREAVHMAVLEASIRDTPLWQTLVADTYKSILSMKSIETAKLAESPNDHGLTNASGVRYSYDTETKGSE